MTGESDLAVLLATMEPLLRAEPYVFTTSTTSVTFPPGVDPVAVVREPEGTTYVLEQGQADRAGLAYDAVQAMITLRVHSSLEAVGLTAAVATALADVGLPCNVVAGWFHDHLFVPASAADEAMAVLGELAQA